MYHTGDSLKEEEDAVAAEMAHIQKKLQQRKWLLKGKVCTCVLLMCCKCVASVLLTAQVASEGHGMYVCVANVLPTCC